MELQNLRTLVAVAEAESLTRAADQLHLSQPAVSAQIKALETELGLTLFHRTGRGMRLTEPGAQLLKNARDILTRADGMIRRAAELNGGVDGVLRLGWIDCGYELKLAQIVGKARQCYPTLRIELSTDTSTDNVRSLLDQELDIAFAEGDIHEPRLRLWRLGTSRVGIIAPTAWREQLADGDWARLGEFPWVFQSPNCSYSRLMDRLCSEHDVTLRPEFRTQDFGAVRDLVAEGLAMSVADLDSVRPWIESGDVWVWQQQAYEMPVGVGVLASREREPTIRALLAIVREAHRSPRRRARTPADAT